MSMEFDSLKEENAILLYSRQINGPRNHRVKGDSAR